MHCKFWFHFWNKQTKKDFCKQLTLNKILIKQWMTQRFIDTYWYSFHFNLNCRLTSQLSCISVKHVLLKQDLRYLPPLKKCNYCKLSAAFFLDILSMKQQLEQNYLWGRGRCGNDLRERQEAICLKGKKARGGNSICAKQRGSSLPTAAKGLAISVQVNK